MPLSVSQPTYPAFKREAPFSLEKKQWRKKTKWAWWPAVPVLFSSCLTNKKNVGDPEVDKDLSSHQTGGQSVWLKKKRDTQSKTVLAANHKLLTLNLTQLLTWPNSLSTN